MSENSKYEAKSFNRVHPSPVARFGLVIPTLNAGEHLDRMLPALQSQTLFPARYLPTALNRRLGMNRRHWMNRNNTLDIPDPKRITAEEAHTG